MKPKIEISACILLLLSTWAHISVAMETDLVHFPNPVHTEHNMSVLIRSLGGIEIAAGSELACITQNGYVAGAINLDDIQNGQWGMAVWGDDLGTEEIDGFGNDEDLRFIYWDAEHEWELDLFYDISQGYDYYQANAFLVIDAVVSIPEITPTIPVEYGITELYPNPFNNTLIIGYSLPIGGFTKLSIYDIAGKELVPIISEFVNYGAHQHIFKNVSMPSGSYFIVLKQKNSISKQKIVLLK